MTRKLASRNDLLTPGTAPPAHGSSPARWMARRGLSAKNTPRWASRVSAFSSAAILCMPPPRGICRGEWQRGRAGPVWMRGAATPAGRQAGTWRAAAPKTASAQFWGVGACHTTLLALNCSRGCRTNIKRECSRGKKHSRRWRQRAATAAHLARDFKVGCPSNSGFTTRCRVVPRLLRCHREEGEEERERGRSKS